MTQLLLASNSSTRRKLLQAAGVPFQVVAPDVDENQLRKKWQDQPVQTIAAKLGEEKALNVSSRFPAAIVIGADQTLLMNNRIHNKSGTLTQAFASLKTLSGQEHILQSAVTLAKQGKTIWSFVDEARLTMRQLSETEISHHIAAEPEAALNAVGGYYLEGRGIQLFERIEGDYFTILGLPLLPLMTALRRFGVPML
jgi:septum formation protein